MRYRTLGELEVVDDDGQAVPVRGTKLRMLLLLLIVDANETVRSDRLADALWGDEVPSGAANALQAQVSKLRRSFGAGREALTTVEGGYRLDVADDAVDAWRFARLADQGRIALSEGDTATAVDLLGQALDLWHGPALDGSADEGTLRREADRLDELRWTVREDRFDAQLRTGEAAALVSQLEAAVHEAPLRERLHGFLMIALYRSGRQADALRAFQAARELLGEELGLDPGPELVAIESAVLAQDPSLHLDRPAPHAAARRRTNLTPALSTFIGRADALDALDALVSGHRLVTIVGPGGAGKTRLAEEVGLRRAADEDVWLVELAAVTDPEAVGAAVLTTLGVPDAGIGGPVAATDLDRVAEHIGARLTLLVLDNCEHVVAEAAATAEHLLRASPGLRVLATSREALGIGGETLWPVPPLSTEDAVDLFTDRADAVGGLPTGGEHGPAVSELCTRLDGLPLAIELAAARSRSIPVEQLASRLDDRFRLLTGGARTALPRQQTLRAVVEWSYDLLFADEQQVFDRLAVFAGGCSLPAAEAVCSGGVVEPEDVADVLARLVDKSLVVAEPVDGVARFRLLQTLSLYGQERLAAKEQAAEVRSRHADHFRAFAEEGNAAFRGRDQVRWLAAARRERDNLSVALAWYVAEEDAEAALSLVAGIAWTYWHTGGKEEGVRLIDAALSCPGTAPAALRAQVTMWAATVRSMAGTGLDHALELGHECMDLWTEAGDDQGLGESAALVGGIHVMRGLHDRANELFDRSAALLAPGEDHWCRAVVASSSGRAAQGRGQFDAAEALYTEAVTHFAAAGVVWAVGTGWSDVALLADQRGDLDAAEHANRQSLAAARELGMNSAVAQLLTRLGNAALTRGDDEAAATLYDEALAVAEEFGALPSAAYAHIGRAMTHRRAGRFDEAADDAEAALVVFRRGQVALYIAQASAILGFLAECRGDLDQARRRHGEALAQVRDTGDGRATALALEGLAGVARASGDPRGAAALLGLAARLRLDAGGAPVGPLSDRDRIVEATRHELGDEDYEKAVAGGEAMALDELVPAG